MSQVSEQIAQAVREAATDGRISCTVARGIATDLGVPVTEIGKACDELGIKIYGCELGCF